MNTNILGYKSDVRSNQLIAARNAAIDLGDGHIALVQSFRGGMQHQVNNNYEVGSSAVYLVVGNPEASFSCSALLSKDGFFAPFTNIASKAACGELKTVNVNLGAELDCDPIVTTRATAKFTGAICRGLSFSIQAGQNNITQEADFIAGSLEVV